MSEMSEFDLDRYITPEMSPENRIAVYAERIAYELQKMKPQRRYEAAHVMEVRSKTWAANAKHLINAGAWEEVENEGGEEK